MKRKTVFIIIFSFFTVTVLNGQTIRDTWNFANQQFTQGNYTQALTDYQRVAFFDNANNFNGVFQKIGESFYALGEFNRALQNFDIAMRLAQNDSLKTELVFKKVNCLFKQENFLFALNELFVISDSLNLYLQNKFNLYMGIGYFGIGNYEESEKYFSKIIIPGTIPQLNEIFNDFKKFRKRFRPSKIQTMSMIFPGLGQIYSGHILSGLNSIVLVGSIAVVTVYIWQTYSFIDAALSMGSWYYRYFSGGYRNAEILAIEKTDHEKEEVYHSILKLVQNNMKSGQ